MLVWPCLTQTAFNRGDNQLLYESLCGGDHNRVTMLYTGLDGKDGKPIYEGDIVECWSQGSKGRFEVRWRQSAGPCWILYPAWLDGRFWYLSGSKNEAGEWADDGVTVLGNIYENPELRPATSA